MHLNIDLTVDLEAVLRHRASAVGMDLAAYVEEMVRESVAEEADASPVVPPEEFARRLDRWIGLHPVLDHAVDDSRESIDAGRGE